MYIVPHLDLKLTIIECKNLGMSVWIMLCMNEHHRCQTLSAVRFIEIVVTYFESKGTGTCSYIIYRLQICKLSHGSRMKQHYAVGSVKGVGEGRQAKQGSSLMTHDSRKSLL